MTVLDRINNEIERAINKVWDGGNNYAESVTVTLELTETEVAEFAEIELDDRYYFDLEDETLTITYRVEQ